MLDYLIVGLGLAGVSFSDKLLEKGKSFKVISDASQTSSLVAGGLYNPVILKRFTLAWKADLQIDLAQTYYRSLEAKLDVKLNHPLRVFRRFNSSEEQNQWFEASDKKSLSKFLSSKVHQNSNGAVDAPFGYGEVLHTGRIDTAMLIRTFKDFLLKKALLKPDTFDHEQLQIHDTYIEYKGEQARRIVFAEGFGIKQNPFFNYLPVNGNKGEYLIIKSPELKEVKAIKSSIFVIPLGDDLYQVGANYEWKDKSNEPTTSGRNWILERLQRLVNCDFEIVDQLAGVRPTVATDVLW